MPSGPVELVLLLHGQPRHPPALGGQRVAGAGQLLLLHEQLLARGLPLLRRHDRWCVHRRDLLPLASSAIRLIAARRASHCDAMPAIQRAVSPSGSVRTRVADLAARAPALHEAGAVEDREVLDHRHAADRQLAGQRRRGALAALGEQAEHAPAGRVRQRGEHPLRRRAHQTATFSAYSRSSPVSNSQPSVLLSTFLARCSSDVASEAKPLSTTRSRVRVALGLQRELDQRRVALDRLLAARVLERRPAVGEARVRLDRDDAAVARAVLGPAQDHRAAGPQVDLGAGVAEPAAEVLGFGDQRPHALDGRVDDGLSLDLVGDHVEPPGGRRVTVGLHISRRDATLGLHLVARPRRRQRHAMLVADRR